MIARNDAELRDQTSRRDAQSVGTFEVRYTGPEPWIAALKADYRLKAIADSTVWLSVVGGYASLEQVAGGWRPGAERNSPDFRSRYVEASYIARGQMTKLSAYCGVAPVNLTGAASRALGEATGLRIQETARKVQSALSRMPGLDVRSGGALHLHDAGDPWMAMPETSIEALPEVTCAACGEDIYFANDAWRHKSTRQAEAYDEVACRQCNGKGELLHPASRQPYRCQSCMGTGKTKALNHVAEA